VTRKKTKTVLFPDAKQLAAIGADPDFERAYAALAKKQKGPWVGENLSGAFAVRASLVVLPAPNKGEFRERTFLEGTGKSWKAMTEFSERLVKMAFEIEALNARFFSIPEGTENPTHIGFRQLPINLRCYGTALNSRLELIKKRFKPRSQSNRMAELSHFTKQVTGAYLDREVAELLNATAFLMEYEPDFDALKLSQARNRYPHPFAPIQNLA
jgi:hypothetical protein